MVKSLHVELLVASVLYLFVTVQATVTPIVNEHSLVHAFYYIWYNAPTNGTASDGSSSYQHWNHEVLPHWTESVNQKYAQIGTRFQPPQHLHSPFYPQLGPYSSADKSVIRLHLQQMLDAGIGVVVVSWWGRADRLESTDTQGVCTDKVIGRVLDVADEFEGRIAVAFHLEPYLSRTALSVAEDVDYILHHYGSHASVYRLQGRVVFYVYDSYHIPVSDWQAVLLPDGAQSIRRLRVDTYTHSAESIEGADTVEEGKQLEGNAEPVFIGLWLDRHHGEDLHAAGFDGAYSYFASDGFSYGSSSKHWAEMCSFLRSRRMLCSLSVGPGYDDTGIRPWNAHNRRPRVGGEYYQRMWRAAVAARPTFVRCAPPRPLQSSLQLPLCR